MSILSEVREYLLVNDDTGCHYMFRDYSKSHGGCIEVLINGGHGWEVYDSAMVGGNYSISGARTFWNSLIKQGFTTNYEI